MGGAQGLKVCIVFEGRDGAGKGGTIKAITERVSPRVFRVIAPPAPTEREKSQMYFQRYMPHLPAAGEVVIFDRSWYNRAGVERVMGFCSADESKRFLRRCPWSSGDGRVRIILLKFWLEVSAEEQERRLRDRVDDGASCETVADGPEVLRQGTPTPGARRHVRGHRFVVRRGTWHARGQEACAAERHQPPLAHVPCETLPAQKVVFPRRIGATRRPTIRSATCPSC